MTAEVVGVGAEGGVSGQVAEELLRLVRGGGYAPGSRLPSERALTERFGVSRASVRQAVQALAGRGVLEVRGRSGVYVQTPSDRPVREALAMLLERSPNAVSIGDLLEVRGVLETELAALAAERRTPDDLRALGEALADCGGAGGIAAWAEADVAFHAALATATRNPLFTLLYAAMRSVFLAQRLRTGAVIPDTRAKSFRYHQRIFDRVCAGDAAGARRAMRDHLREARQTLLQVAAAGAALEAETVLAPVTTERGKE